MKSTSLKFAGLLTTALVAPALLASAATAKDSTARETELSVTNNRVQTPLAAAMFAKLNTGELARIATSDTDRLLLWHSIMLDSNALDHTPGPLPGTQQGPVRNARAFGMTQLAVFDAVNAFKRKFNAYNNIGGAATGASVGAAIAYSAHDVLVFLYPNQKTRLDQLLVADISVLSNNGASPTAIAGGRTIGQASAAAMILRRTNDGSAHSEPTFGGGGLVANNSSVAYQYPGQSGLTVNGGQTAAPAWSPDPVGVDSAGNQRRVALGGRWGNVRPFVLTRGDQFRLPPPPAPNTAAFRTAFDEVRFDGASADTPGSTTTPAKLFIGNFWGYDGAPLLGTPPRLYNQIAVKIANDQGLTKVENYARYLALINSAMGDAGVGAWDSKYFYNYWRPVTGVRRAAEDGDTATDAVAGWKPVGASVINSDHPELFTPPFPAYPSGHATFGGALFQVMRSFFPNNTRFTFTSDEYNGLGLDPNGTPRPLVPVRYRSLQEAQDENGQSRIFNGVHWQYDNTGGQSMGVKIGNFTVANALTKR
ncbi:MAG: chloroperoxidase [Pseudomonadota bacterium]